MRVTAADLDRYRAAVSAQQAQARAFVEASILQYAAAYPDATVADLREAGIAALSQAEAVYGEAACAAACVEYDAVASALGADVEPAVAENAVDEGAIERDARYLAGLVEPRGVAEYARRMASKAHDHALFAANRTMAANAARPRDVEAGMRYARVPSGRETCGFCLMLASRGFDYGSREAAGDRGGPYNSYHSHCDCTVVAGAEGTEVEGYDPAWLRDVYADARSTVEGGAHEDWKAAGGEDGTGKTYDEYLRDRIAREIETRDREWAWTGKVPEVTYAKPRERLLPHEQSGVDLLVRHGFKVETIPEDPKAPANLDVLMGGHAWEMKNVTNARGSVGNQLARARRKFHALGRERRYFVITTEGSRDPFDKVVAGVGVRLRAGEEALVLGGGEYEIQRIRR